MIVLRFFLLLSIITACIGIGRVTELIFPKGTVFTITVSLTSFLPNDLARGSALLLELDFTYPIVAKDDAKMKPPPKTRRTDPFGIGNEAYEMEKFRRNEALKEKQRRYLRSQLVAAIDRVGYDGKKCVRRFLCEVGSIRRPETAFEDLLLILYRVKGADCRGYRDLCPFSLLQIVMNSQKV